MQETQTQKKPACYIPTADTDWLLEQKDPALQQLFIECWCADPSGSHWVPLVSKLRGSIFTKAKEKLSKQRLFAFKLETSEAKITGRWVVKNLHGSSNKDFWRDTKLD